MITDYLAINSDDIKSQIEKLGGLVYLWSSPNTINDSTILCNTGIVKVNRSQYLVAQRLIYNRNGKLTINWRENPSEIVLSYLNIDNFKLEFCNTISLLEEYSIEDPRLSISENGIELWVSRWKLKHDRATTDQIVILLDNDLSLENINCPQIGLNNKVGYEKNWLPIIYTNYFVYKINETHQVYDRFKLKLFQTSGIKWEYGEIHGGTPCVEIENGQYLSIFQSSLPIEISEYESITVSKRYYFIGAYIFSKYPPFKILKYSKNPILYSSFKNSIILNSPCCLFPTGLTISGGSLILTLGINDCSSACAVIPLESLLDKLIEF
jgi:hypothetical protein